MLARIYERGSGFPDTGSYVLGVAGIYRVTGESFGPIQTGNRTGNWLSVEVAEADYEDCAEEEIFPAVCVPIPTPEDYCAEWVRRGWEVERDMLALFRLRPDGLEMDTLAGFLVEKYPFLVDTVQDVLAELRGVSE